jgi:hypothetical protein
MAPDEQGSGDDPTGEYVVDIAEYYGDAAPDKASKIVYRQLKHSTEHPDQPWPVSGLSATVGARPRRCPAPCPEKETMGFIRQHASPPRHL